MEHTTAQAGQPPLELDEFESGLLPLLRHFMTSLQQPGTQAWQHAFKTAAERWGSGFGLGVAQALFEVVRGVHAHRGAEFACHDALCLAARGKLTADEAAFLQMIRCMRRDQTAPARDALGAVMAGRMDPGVIRAGLAFAQRFPAGQPVRACHASARLRVAS